MDISKYLERNIDIIFRCDTEDKSKQLLDKLYELGFTWNNGKSLLANNNWNKYKSCTCYWIDIPHQKVTVNYFNNALETVEYKLDNETIDCDNMNFPNIVEILQSDFLENKMPVLLLDGKPINKIEISVKDDVYNINLLSKED